jgi:hypothetical protein
MPWYFKLAFGAGAAFAMVKATAAAVSHEHPWNGQTLKWLGIMVALLVGCGLASYYCHMYLESDEGDDQQESSLIMGAGGQGPGVGGRVACYPHLSCENS